MKVIYIWIISWFNFIACNAQVDTSILSRIDSIFSQSNDSSPGYMLGVIQCDSFLLQKGYGLANLEHNIPISSKTSFNIASLSKQITGAAIAQLILDNKLSEDDLVIHYLPEFPFTDDSVQIKHLIYMTSGINDYHYNIRGMGTDWSSLHFFDIDDAITASYSSKELMYKPGTQWSYSNINYMLLTKIVEKITGKSFSQYVEENIFKPLSMDNTLVNDDIFQVIPNRAMGYNYRTKGETNWLLESGYLRKRGTGFLQIHRNSPHYGGSGIYTTMDDWKKWLTNLSHQELGGQAFYNLIHKTMKFEHNKFNDAYGLVVDKYENKEVVWYEGGDWGFSSFMIRFPETETSIICFSNLGSGNTKEKVWGVYDILKESRLID